MHTTETLFPNKVCMPSHITRTWSVQFVEDIREICKMHYGKKKKDEYLSDIRV